MSFILPRRRKKKRASPEALVQKPVLEWLETTGMLFWRQNAGTLLMGGYKVNLGMKGLPDVIIIVPPKGRMLGLEIKPEKGGTWRQSQKDFARRLTDAGGMYRLVRSLKQAKEAVEQALYEESPE